jgi:hypothetical protein
MQKKCIGINWYQYFSQQNLYVGNKLAVTPIEKRVTLSHNYRQKDQSFNENQDKNIFALLPHTLLEIGIKK